MLPLIRDLHAYQAWADAEVLHFVEGTKDARSDPRILELLNHIYMVHRFFLLSVQGAPPSREELMRELPFDELACAIQNLHTLADTYFPKVRESHLDDRIEVPWFKDYQPTSQEALTQAALHSQNHRGQLLTLLRTMGAVTRPLDYILWVSQGRPAARWQRTATASL
jgi:uncharacterized damage-inducible protein DinB